MTRKSTRLPGYDYSQPGYYFVTICVHLKYRQQLVFGAVRNGIMQLNEYGKIGDQYWREIPEHYENIFIDEYVIMPDHIHGIVIIQQNANIVGAEQCSAPTMLLTTRQNYGKLSKIVKSFKNAVTNKIRNTGFPDFPWQRSFHDRIIRNNGELNRIRQYIQNNPARWEEKNAA